MASGFGLSLDNLLNFYRPKLSAIEKNIALEFSNQVLKTESKIHPTVISSSPNLLKLFSDKNISQGITVTCPGFYGPQGRVVRNKLALPNLINDLNKFQFRNTRITNFEMETAAIYGMARMMGHDALSLSAIVANRVLKQFSKNGHKAVQNLINLTLEKLCS